MHIVIPARLNSTRLPGKPLADVAGKPLIQRVHECARRTAAQTVVIATDDERVLRVASEFGADVSMTSADHVSGTDRIAEIVRQRNWKSDEIIVNLQGDEPLLPPSLIDSVAAILSSRPDAAMATACHPITARADLDNPNITKLVCDVRGYALYFSRAPIPWPRAAMDGESGRTEFAAMRHIGLYAYRAEFITRYSQWPACALEQAEHLEQLRALWYGARIVVHVTKTAPEGGVDTPEDLERVRRYFSKKV
jgi:3-deoxy-manno-octulosonate cytidylyltransferase (CMP-KDO synthetase)